MTFAAQILSYQFSLTAPFPLMDEIEWLVPYEDEETRRVMSIFYHQYYEDSHHRIFILGINPGRFGAGITGVPFTDPIRLEEIGIENSFSKRQELSSVFIYDMIRQCGGPDVFYKKYYITSLSPLGFVKHGKNYNYYDDRTLSGMVRDYIIENIQTQIQFGADPSVVYCLGQGKNYTFLESLNKEFKWWERVVPLPHPRWIMQYKLKKKEEFIELYKSFLQLKII
jgi:hypothetical protein